MDKIYEAYASVINESFEKDILKRVVKNLKAYKKKPGHITLSAVEDVLDTSGKKQYSFSDTAQKTLEFLGSRFFGPPKVQNTSWDSALDRAIAVLEKEAKK